MNQLVGIVVSVVVAGVIILIIGRMTLQGQERSVNATQQRAIRTSESNLVGMVEFDLQNIGSNHPAYELPPDSAITEFDTLGTDRAFSYIGQTQRGMPPDIVRYTWTVSGTKTIKRGTVDLYDVKRWINGQLTGTSSGAVTRFSIGMLDSGGAPATRADARQIQIGVSMVSGLGESSMLGETHWDSIVRPTALARLDYEKYL
jgi:hypothetical protein